MWASVEELAAASCGEVSSAIAWAGGATSDLMLLRQTVRTFGAASGLAEQLVVEHGNATSVGRDASDATRTFVAALDAAGLAEALSGAQRDALARLDDASAIDIAGVRYAALAAGVCIAPAPASREALRAGALVAGIALVRSGLLEAPWVAPSDLDAATRAAAVQADRTARWDEWTAAWCALFTREARAASRRLRALHDGFTRDRDTVRAAPRVGATDAVVFEWLQSHVAFTIRAAAAGLGLTTPTVGTAIERLEAAGYAAELTGQRRDRIWVATASLALITEH
jgi:DNA-binding MarR family transcriptional regulator